MMPLFVKCTIASVSAALCRAGAVLFLSVNFHFFSPPVTPTASDSFVQYWFNLHYSDIHDSCLIIDDKDEVALLQVNKCASII